MICYALTMSTRQTLPVTGMTSCNCVAKVQERLDEHADIEFVTVILQPQDEVQAKRAYSSDDCGISVAHCRG